MSQASAPADNVDFQSSSWRALQGPLGDVVLDARTNTSLGYPLSTPLPSTGNLVTLGSGSSRVAGFLHQCIGPESITIPASVGGTVINTIVVRYDPTFTSVGGSFPCRIVVLSGTAGGPAPTLQTGPTGAEDLPLWNITRGAGAALSTATIADRRVWVAGSAVAVSPDIGLGGAPPSPLQPIPGRRTVVTDGIGRALITFPIAFPTAIHSVTGLTVELAAAGWAGILPGSMSRTGFTVLLRAANGAPLSTQTVTFMYVAWGY